MMTIDRDIRRVLEAGGWDVRGRDGRPSEALWPRQGRRAEWTRLHLRRAELEPDRWRLMWLASGMTYREQSGTLAELLEACADVTASRVVGGVDCQPAADDESPGLLTVEEARCAVADVAAPSWHRRPR
jgi:hypothetical protein